MKTNKNLMLLLAAGAAYWYFAIYLKNKAKNPPIVDETKMQQGNSSSPFKDVWKDALKEGFTDKYMHDWDYMKYYEKPNVPLIEAAPPRLRPLAYQPDVVPEIDSYNVKYTMSGYKSLGGVPNII